MITTTQDAWVKSFIEEPAITVVILDVFKFITSFFVKNITASDLWIHL